jgi:hypothetical protein
MPLDDDFDRLAQIWDDLLSGEPEKVIRAFAQLPKTDQKAVLEHLQEMVEGEGWQSAQRESATVALNALN